MHKSDDSQICLQRPPLGPPKSGRCREGGRSLEFFQSKLVLNPLKFKPLRNKKL